MNCMGIISNITNFYCRSITKILGEWWANLDKEEKACYTGLAKQVIFLTYKLLYSECIRNFITCLSW